MITLGTWIYLRIWYFATVVLKTIVSDPTTSFIFPCSDGRNNPDCVIAYYTEMGFYVLLLGSLLFLNVVWLVKMLQRGINNIFPGKNKKE